MGYKDMVLGTLTQTAIDERNNTYFKMAQEVEEVYRKAKAFDEILNVDYIVAPDDYAHEITKIVDKYREEQ